MILRKPYAMLIKYFKLLHLVLSMFSVLLLYRSFTLFNFFRIYSLDFRSALGEFSQDRYLTVFSFVFAIIILIINVILLVVMIYKQKPKTLYIFNIALFIGVTILYVFCLSALGDVKSIVLDIKYSKALRDVSLIASILQFTGLVLTVVRATGFDIKRFDFGEDLQKLDISDKDSEEIEVALNFDKDGLIRNSKYKFRNLKYLYFEHKFIINTALISLVVLISVFTIYKVNSYTETYDEGQTFSVGGYTMNILDSYILDSSTAGVKLVETEGDSAGAIVAVRFQVKSYLNKQTFNTGIVNLRINGLSYSQNSQYAKENYDIAQAYTGQLLEDEFNTYILTYEVSKTQASSSMKLKINDQNSFVDGVVGAKNVVVKLKPKDLRKDSQQIFTKKIGETISFDDSVLASSNLTVNSFDIDSKFELEYNFCYATDKCFTSYEYVTPTATGNYFKSLMRIKGKMAVDKNINIPIYDLREFLNNFGTLSYKVNDEEKSFRFNSEIVKPKTAKTDDYFIEVPMDVKNATEINLNFKIRNQYYKYVLK